MSLSTQPGGRARYATSPDVTLACAPGAATTGRAAGHATVRRYSEVATLIVILVVAAAVRLLWVRWFPMTPESDFATFLDMATKISDGLWRPEEYGWVYQGSGYPTLIAPLIALGGGLDGLRLANVVAQVLMVAGVWGLARSLFGPRGAAIAGLAAAILPGLWSYAPLLAAESVAMALLVAVALLLRSPGPLWRSGVLGVATGMLAFTRPSFLPFVLLVAVAVPFLSQAGRWKRLVWFLAGLLLIAVPIMALNTANGGPPLPSGAAGWQTWLVNNEHATGSWFDAYADDAYPFAGLQGEAETRAAQSMLGQQFIAANPLTAVEAMVDRYRLNWLSDEMGLGWTLDRAPAGWQARAPFSGHLKDVAQILYVVVLGLAAIAAVRHRTRVTLLLPIVLPLGYAMAILAVAEANARYHAMFLPLICVMAGGALVPVSWRGQAGRSAWRRRLAGRRATLRRGSWRPWLPRVLTVVVGVAAVLWSLSRALGGRWEQDQYLLPPWLIAVVVTVPLAGCAVSRIATHWQAVISWAGRPSWTWLAVGGICIAIAVLPIRIIATGIEQRLTAVAAVSPSGWERQVTLPGPVPVTEPDPEPAALPLLLESSGTDPDLRQVSFPDAALLQFDTAPRRGTVVELSRSLPGLTVGEAYVFYLQVYDPGTDGDATERLTITLNGAVAWEQAPGRTEPGAWEYVRVDWVADTTSLTLTVFREAGQHFDPDQSATPRVRTLHLYPAY